MPIQRVFLLLAKRCHPDNQAIGNVNAFNRIPSANKVVVKFKDKSVLKGKTGNFYPDRALFHLLKLKGDLVEIRLEQLKAIFFVKNFDGNKDHAKAYGDKIEGCGRKLKVIFLDGEKIIGYTTRYSPDRQGFYMIPADLKGNNERVFVVKSATKKIEIFPA